MNTLDLHQHGFFGVEAKEWLQEQSTTRATVYEHARQLNSIAHKILLVKRPIVDYRVAFVIPPLSIRALEFYQSTILLSELGIDSAAKTTLRSLFESCIRLVACVKDESCLDAYSLESLTNHKKYINTTLEFKNDLSDDRKQALNESLDHIKTEIKDLKYKGSFSTMHFCERAGLEKQYNPIYRVLSACAHSTIKDLEKLANKDNTGEITSFNYGPVDKTEWNLLVAVQLLTRILETVSKYYSLDTDPEYERVAREFSANVQRLNGFKI